MLHESRAESRSKKTVVRGIDRTKVDQWEFNLAWHRREKTRWIGFRSSEQG